ncbi:MAG: aryl-sulfate sulfotransferase [Anaerolineae bacterium]|nr:aryl-sulfate sulfotransferase [Anaerolineae bacterium]
MNELGVRTFVPSRCWHGYTLFCHTVEDVRHSASGAGHIYLIDMEGRTVHEWVTHTAQQSFCRLLPDGTLVYPTRDRSRIEEAGIRALDPDSNLLWHYHCRIDHDFQVLESGNLLLHTIDDYMVPALGPGLKRNPYMIEVTPGFELVWEWRGEEHLDDLRRLLSARAWAHVQERIRGEFSFDWAHNNTCQIVPANATAERESARGGPVRFRPGNIVFSYRSLDVIGVIDRETGAIVWAWGPGEIDGQHKPHVLPNGNILLFDNGTLRGYSRVIELDPLTGVVEWSYVADPPETFLSRYISGAQRLPNGNTLICEGSECHLFEVTPDGEVVWDYRSPHREPGAMAIYRCLRYTPGQVQALIGRSTG